MPCTDLPDDVIGRNDDGFILTGPCIGADNLLQTTVPGVFAAGDVRFGSTKRCATAVGKEAGPYNSSTPASRHADHPNDRATRTWVRHPASSGREDVRGAPVP